MKKLIPDELVQQARERQLIKLPLFVDIPVVVLARFCHLFQYQPHINVEEKVWVLSPMPMIVPAGS